MSSPLMVERVVRAILRSFVHAGIIPSYTDTAKIEAIPANYSDAQIDAVLSTIAFTTATPSTPVLTSDIIRGTDDVNVFVDSDNDDTALGFVRYFRVAQDQTDPPVTVATRELMTVGRDIFDFTLQGTTLTVGPRASLGGTHAARINIGTNGTLPYGSIFAGSTQVNGAEGMTVKGYTNLALRATQVRVYDPTGMTVRGGWSATATTARMHVGDYTATDSLVFEQVGTAPSESYVIRTERSSGSFVKRIYVRGSEANTHAVHMIVGGHESTHSPTSLGNATFAVVGDNVGAVQNVVYFYDRKATRTAGYEVFTISTDAPRTDNYYVMRILVGGVGTFRIDSNGNVRALGTFVSGACDVAELFPADRAYVPGTVVTTSQGKCVASTNRAQTTVVGVVSTKPGVEIGQDNVYNTASVFPLTVVPFDTATSTLVVNAAYTPNMLGTHVRVNHISFIKIESIEETANITTIVLAETVSPNASLEAGVFRAPYSVVLALSGFVPVRCSTEYGNITGNGDLLVSGPNGYAVLAPDPPAPGTILGKAFSPLLAPDGDDPIVEYGIVNVLVALQ